MTLSSRHRIRNSSPGGLRPSTLPLGHGGSRQYRLSHVNGEETCFVSFKPPRPGTEPRRERQRNEEHNQKVPNYLLFMILSIVTCGSNLMFEISAPLLVVFFYMSQTKFRPLSANVQTCLGYE